MTGQRWEIRDGTSGVTLAELHGTHFNQRSAARIAEDIATVIGVSVTRPMLRTGPLRNPTLAAHGAGAASWHVLTEKTQHPVADFYRVSKRQASAMARALADQMRVALRLYDNAGLPRWLSEHRQRTVRPNPKRGGRNPRQPTMKEAGYAFVRNDGPGTIIVREIDTGKLEQWGANKGHASAGFRYRGTDWEFLSSSGIGNPSRSPRARASRKRYRAAVRGIGARVSRAGVKATRRPARPGGAAQTLYYLQHHDARSARRKAGLQPNPKGHIHWHEAPRPLGELARTRVDYEGGRFLRGAVVGLSADEKQHISDYLVRIGHWTAYEPGTVEWRIETAARELAATKGGEMPTGGRYWTKPKRNPPRMPRRQRRAAASGRFVKAQHHAAASVARGVRRLDLQRRLGFGVGRAGVRPNTRGRKINVGDRVRYSAAWLRSTGTYTGDLPQAKGVVVKLTPFGGPGNALATIEWDREGVPEKVLTANLVRMGQLEANPAPRNAMRVAYLPANKAWAWVWGDSMLRPAPDLPILWDRRADLVSALDAIGIQTAKDGVTTSKPGMRLPESNRRKRHPKGQMAKVRGKAHRNPRDPEVARAERTFRHLNEIEPGKITKVRTTRGAPKVLAQIGVLHSVVYESDKYAGGPDNPKGKKLLYEHKTRPPRPILATDPEGKEVHIVGGRMRPTADGLVN